MEVVCMGLMVCDILVKPITKDILDRDTTRVEFVKMSSGGDAFNVAVNLAKLGVSSGIAGKIGNDGFGDFLLRTAADNGVDSGGVVVTGDIGTSTSVVLIHPDGERSFAYYGGATDKLDENDIDFEKIKGARIFSVGSAFGLPGFDGEKLAGVLKRARESGMETIMDVTGCMDLDSFKILKPALQYIDIFIPSFNEAKSLTGREKHEEIAKEFIKHGVKTVVIKLGNEGCYIKMNDVEITVPSFRVDAVDTTGAGDSFVAGFITAYTKGWPLNECGRFANATGALCVQEVGATTGTRPLKDVVEFIKSKESELL